MYNDSDSVSTFHKADDKTQRSCPPSTTFTPVIVSNPPSAVNSTTTTSKPNDVNLQDNDESISKLSDTQSRISSLEQDIRHLNTSFQTAFSEMKLQSQRQASQQQQYDATLHEILSLLKQNTSTQDDSNIVPSAQDNPPKQLPDTSGSSGVAGGG